MDPAVALQVLAREAAAFADLLDGNDLAAPVASCPGWTLLDLAGHLGGVHRWARHAVLSGPPFPTDPTVPTDPTGPTEPAALATWLREGAHDLVRTLAAHDPEQPCWAFAPPFTVGFWLRRQAHETTLHRWDAASSLGSAVSIPDAVADDGIDEVVSVFVPRQVRLGRLVARRSAIELVSPSGGSTLLSSGDRHSAAPTATVTGPAEPLLLLLWGRTTLADPRLAVSGSVADARRLLAEPLTP